MSDASLGGGVALLATCCDTWEPYPWCPSLWHGQGGSRGHSTDSGHCHISSPVRREAGYSVYFQNTTSGLPCQRGDSLARRTLVTGTAWNVLGALPQAPWTQRHTQDRGHTRTSQTWLACSAKGNKGALGLGCLEHRGHIHQQSLMMICLSLNCTARLLSEWICLP